MADPIVNTLGIVGIKNCGAYNAATNYEKLNVVTYEGSSYCAKGNTVGNLPTNTTYWDLLAQKGDKGATGNTGPIGPAPVRGVDYWTASDIAAIESDLSDDVAEEVGIQIGSLTSATPLVASSTSEMTDTTKIYVNTTDGKWYYYDGDSWEIGGTYQTTGIGENTITFDELSPYLKTNYIENSNMLNTTVIKTNTYLNTSGAEFTVSNYSCSDFIEIDAENTIYVKKLAEGRVAEYNDNKDFIKYTDNINSLTPNASTKYIKYAFPTNKKNNCYVSYENILYNLVKTPYMLNGSTISNNSIDNLSINNIDVEKLNGVEIVSHNLYDKNKPYSQNRYLDNFGNIFEAANYITTDFLSINPSTEYSSNFEKVCFYDKYLNCIGSSTYNASEANNHFTTAENCFYYRACFLASQLGSRMINKGSTLYNWDQYLFTINNLQKIITNPIISNNIAGLLYDNSHTTKIVTVGDSITAGSGGTGYNENGSEIGTTGYHRNETGYCWANLLKQNLESKFNCTVTNNGISGIYSGYVANHLEDLIPTDTDVALVMIGTNDRTYQNYYESFYGNLTTIYNYCELHNIKLILIASVPASVTDEERENGTFSVRYKHMEDINNVISAFAINHEMTYIDTFEELYMFAMARGVPFTNYLFDGLHPNDSGYYLLFRFISKGIGVDAKIENATWDLS